MSGFQSGLLQIICYFSILFHPTVKKKHVSNLPDLKIICYIRNCVHCIAGKNVYFLLAIVWLFGNCLTQFYGKLSNLNLDQWQKQKPCDCVETRLMLRGVAHHELTTCQGGVDALSFASWFGNYIKPPSSLPPLRFFNLTGNILRKTLEHHYKVSAVGEKSLSTDIKR